VANSQRWLFIPTTRLVNLTTWLVGSLLPLILLMASCQRGSQPEVIGRHAPDFVVADSDRRVELSQFHDKVVVLNFWATWCPPCVEEMPSLGLMQSRLPDQVKVVAISVDEDSGAYHRFLQEHNITLLTVRDPEQKANSLYGTHGYPESYIIDRRGIIRRKFIGPVDWTNPELLAYLQKL
jgi:cytochrome c biogenesis protein CcmG, thiol:disulfide interchange protein DsbE